MVIVHPEDVDAYIRMTGSADMSEKFEAEYSAWLKLYHRYSKGSGGPLGPLMVPLLRSLRIGPPHEPEKQEKVDWLKVAPMTPVIVTEDDKRKRTAVFLGINGYEMATVKFDDDPVIRERPPVSLQLTKARAAEKLPEEPAKTDEQPRVPEAHQPSVVEEVDEEIPAYVPDRDDPNLSDLKEPPKMANKEWYQCHAGREVVADIGGETIRGSFVRVGPGEHEITLWTDTTDSQLVVHEDDVAVV